MAGEAGVTVFHAPDVTDGSLSPAGHVVPQAELRRPLLDEAEAGRYGNGIVVPLS
ncbi:hypothetical protein [Streptomyces sp. NPDC127072]|uniref:hypothetical protein n=1 Tax=Streptomyces sp. NPDC127072 TaxID=3347129 RepID=UPI00364E34B7